MYAGPNFKARFLDKVDAKPKAWQCNVPETIRNKFLFAFDKPIVVISPRVELMQSVVRYCNVRTHDTRESGENKQHKKMTEGSFKLMRHPPRYPAPEGENKVLEINGAQPARRLHV